MERAMMGSAIDKSRFIAFSAWARGLARRMAPARTGTAAVAAAGLTGWQNRLQLMNPATTGGPQPSRMETRGDWPGRGAAALLLLALAPLLVLVAALMRLETRGPVLSGGLSMDRAGRIVPVVRFRADSRLGGLLRASGIGALPHLIDIARGDVARTRPRD